MLGYIKSVSAYLCTMGYAEIPRGRVLEFINEHYLGKEVLDSRSPAGNWLRFTLEKIEVGSAVLTTEVRKEMTNPYGHIHGGMMSLVIDEAIGWALVSLDSEEHYTSMSLNVDFLYAIKEGQRLRAMSQVLRKGKRIISVECHVYDLEGKILARANSNLIVTHMGFV